MQTDQNLESKTSSRKSLKEGNEGVTAVASHKNSIPQNMNDFSIDTVSMLHQS